VTSVEKYSSEAKERENAKYQENTEKDGGGLHPIETNGNFVA